jgi:hypothetical protein
MKALAYGTFLGLGLISVSSLAAIPSANDFIQKLNKDQDTSLDLNELNTAANAHYDAADADHDGTVEGKEVTALHLSRTDFSRVKMIKGALPREEFLKLIKNRFDLADKDKDGSLDEKELDSPAGRDLRRLLQ